MVLLVLMVWNIFNQQKVIQKDLIYSEMLSYLEKGEIAEVTIQGERISGKLTNGNEFRTHAPKDDQLVAQLREKKVKIAARPADDSPWYMTIFISWFPFLLLIGVWIFFMRQMQAGGGKAMSFGKSRARLITDKSKKVTFADVAGIDEAKAELEEVIDFLRDPKKYTKLGGRIPKGLLLVGPPGTGKRFWRALLLARRKFLF
jgi:cell division protease FtsH